MTIKGETGTRDSFSASEISSHPKRGSNSRYEFEPLFHSLPIRSIDSSSSDSLVFILNLARSRLHNNPSFHFRNRVRFYNHVLRRDEARINAAPLCCKIQVTENRLSRRPEPRGRAARTEGGNRCFEFFFFIWNFFPRPCACPQPRFLDKAHFILDLRSPVIRFDTFMAALLCIYIYIYRFILYGEKYFLR